MKKLLLVMLVPVLVLGVMSCAEGVTDTEIDAYIQNGWSSVHDGAVSGLTAFPLPAIGTIGDGSVKVFFSGNQLTLKTSTFTSKPYRFEFSYKVANPDSKRWLPAVPTAIQGSTWAAYAATASSDATVYDTIGSVLDMVKGLDTLYNAGNPNANPTVPSTWVSEAVAKPILTKFFDAEILGNAGVVFNNPPLEDNPTTAATVENSIDTLGIVDSIAGILDIVYPATNIAGGFTTRGIVGDVAVYGWEDGQLIATLKVVYAEDTANAGAEQLSIIYLKPDSNAWYKYDLPPLGLYSIMQ